MFLKIQKRKKAIINVIAFSFYNAGSNVPLSSIES